MRIRKLDLKAFGPFTEKELNFPVQSTDFFIVHGPNEAGKSSSLRALTVLLFGFPERTFDNFVHPNDRLLIGGILENKEGRDLSFLRRKKRKNDLLDLDENPLVPGVLEPFLQGVDKDVFLALFGIDHESLVSGGREILAQEGHLGRTLFSAGTGISSLKKVRRALDLRAEELFKVRAVKPVLNQAIKEYAELQKSVRANSLPGSRWRAHEQAYSEARGELSQLTQKKNEVSAELRRLERLKQALPLLSHRYALLEHLAAFESVPPLPKDFPDNRIAAQTGRREAKYRVREAEGRLKELNDQLQKLTVNKEILDAGKEIESLYQGLKRYQKDLSDRPRLEGNRQSLKREAGELFNLIRPGADLEEVAVLYPLLANRRSLSQLGEKKQLLEQNVVHADRQVRTMETEIAALRERIRDLPDVLHAGGLKDTVYTARKAGEIDREIETLETEEGELLSQCTLKLKQQNLWKGELEEIHQLCLPRLATITRFADLFSDLDRDWTDLQEGSDKAGREIVRIREEIRAMEMASDILTEAELVHARSLRDQGWSLLKRKWVAQEGVEDECKEFDPERPILEAYEYHVAKTDTLADRLRREAERVHAYADLRAQEETLASDIEKLQEKEARLAAAKEKLDREWFLLWEPCSINPLPPREMTEWLQAFESLRTRAQELEQIRLRLSRLTIRRRTLRESLEQELSGLGKSFQKGDQLAPVLGRAETVLERAGHVANQHQLLEERLADLSSALKRAVEDLALAREGFAAWEKQWSDSLSDLGLPASTGPAEVNDLIETVARIREKLQEADGYHKRIQGIDRDLELYETQVSHLVQQAAPSLEGLPMEQTVIRLSSLLNRSREKQTLQTKVLQEQEKVEERLQKARATEETACHEMSKLVRIAGCRHEDDLEQVEDRWREKCRAQEDLERLEQQLARIGEGYTIADLESMSKGLDPDTLPDRIGELEHEVEEILDPAIKRRHEILGEERTQLERFDGSGLAAESAENAEQVLARIRRLSEEYVRLKLASKVLDREIERYRAANQDPVLGLASEYFKDLTLGSFQGLRGDVDEQGLPIIAGTRPDGSRIPVEGMSSGTRDQLYLALRLASLEWRLNRSDPMPFIVDDILVNFDEQRAEATLKALARLSEKNQVILFTHHRHVAGMADSLGERFWNWNPLTIHK